jgi:hypothetical protein
VHEVGYKYAVWASAILHAFDRLRVVPGLRVDGFTTNQRVNVSPRLSAVYSLTGDLDLTAAGGLQYQQPEYSDLVIAPTNRSLRPVQVATGIGGLEYYLAPLDAKMSLEGFYKQYRHLPVDSALLSTDPLYQTEALVDTGSGHSYGIELFAQKKLSKTYFWTLAYSFSRSLYEDVRPGHGGQWYPNDYDFRHAFTVTGGWKIELLKYGWYQKLRDQLWFKLLSPIMPIADRIELSAKWRYLGGRPYTEELYSDTEKHYYADTQNELNGLRYEPYHRLDMRYERRFGFGFVQMIYYFDFQNVYNRDNVWYYMYSDRNQHKQPIYQFPFFPVGGIIIGF